MNKAGSSLASDDVKGNSMSKLPLWFSLPNVTSGLLIFFFEGLCITHIWVKITVIKGTWKTEVDPPMPSISLIGYSVIAQPVDMWYL